MPRRVVYPSEREFEQAVAAVRDGEGRIVVTSGAAGVEPPTAVERVSEDLRETHELDPMDYRVAPTPSPTARVLALENDFTRLVDDVVTALAADAVVVLPGEKEGTGAVPGAGPDTLLLNPARVDAALGMVFEDHRWAWLESESRSLLADACRAVAVGSPYRAYAFARRAIETVAAEIDSITIPIPEDSEEPEGLFEREYRDLVVAHRKCRYRVMALARTGDHADAVRTAFHDAFGSLSHVHQTARIAYGRAEGDVHNSAQDRDVSG